MRPAAVQLSVNPMPVLLLSSSWILYQLTEEWLLLVKNVAHTHELIFVILHSFLFNNM